MTTKVLLSWSSGKDSAWALHVLRQDPTVEVVGLLTSVNESAERVAMHGVRERLLERQAQAVGLPLDVVRLPPGCSNDVYEARMRPAFEAAVERGVEAVAFGDLWLEDVRAYRVAQLAEFALEPRFPIWGLDTRALAREMVAAGVRAWLTCVDPGQIPASWAGRAFDADLLDDFEALAEREGRVVDPCAEQGEFHSFAVDGPAFAHPVEVEPGEIVERDGFVFADLVPR